MAKKRANGEGNIRKRKDGRWEGRYTAGYDEKTGKRIIKNVLGKTQAEVKEKLAKAVAEAENVDVRRADEYTLGTWLQTWYELYAKPHLRFSTAEYYRRGIELHITPRIGDIPLKKLTGRDLQWLYKDLQEHGRLREAQKGKQPGLSDSTIRGIHTMLHNALDRAVNVAEGKLLGQRAAGELFRTYEGRAGGEDSKLDVLCGCAAVNRRLDGLL